MSRSAGPGSPIYFYCSKLRREAAGHEPGYLGMLAPYHRVGLTGRTKPYRGRRALGLRSTHTSREYRCSCGHTGWSNHSDLERCPVVCRCCVSHPDEASRQRQPIRCVECGDLCQCRGCVAEEEPDA